MQAPIDGLGSVLDGIVRTLGHFGVDIFFVVSGFIMALLIKNNTSICSWCSASQFLIRRILRIYPLYWITLLAVIFIPMLLGIYSHSDFISVFKFHEASLYSYSPENPVTWTLAFEMRFYIIAALAMLAGSHAVLLLIIWGVFQIFWVLMTALGYWPVVDLFSDGLSLEFILGVLIAYMPERSRLPYPRILALLALLAAFFAPAFFSRVILNICGENRAAQIK